MARTAKSFSRSGARFKEEPRILILCEDSRSSKNYLQDAAVHFRASAEVDIAHCGVTHPSGIVREGVKRSRKYDHVYCVIDRDTHQCFNLALQMARDSVNVTVIPSYPCFEFWLVLHFEHCRRPFRGTQRLSAGEEAVAKLREYAGMENYAKGSRTSLFNQLLGEPLEKARRLSPRILIEAEREGELNPSTCIHLLFELFERLSKPQEIDA